jgi:hypothetical protein
VGRGRSMDASRRGAALLARGQLPDPGGRVRPLHGRRPSGSGAPRPRPAAGSG